MALSRDLSEAQIALQIGEGDPGEFLVIRYRGKEGLCQLYRFEIELTSSAEVPTFDPIVGQPAVLTVNTQYGDRYFHGIISRFELSGETANQAFYRAELVPAVWLLTHRYNSRIFQGKTVKEIIAKILNENGITEDRVDMEGLTESYEPREYCVQYRETDYNFVCRLMEHEGIRWYFTQSEEAHILKLADSPDTYPPIEGQDTILAYRPATGMIATEEHVYRLRMSQCVRPGAVVLNDFNFERPKLHLESEAGNDRDPGLEFSDYPGEFKLQDAGSKTAERRAEEFESCRVMGTAQSNSPRLTVGHTFELSGHSSASLNQSYLVTAILHQGKQAPTGTSTGGNGRPILRDESALRAGSQWLYHGGQVSKDLPIIAGAAGANPLDPLSVPNLLGDTPSSSLADDEAPPYNCRFEWAPANRPYRPARVTPWPVMRGSQTARIVGPEGEEIHTDKYGRVKVQFHWDREGKFDESASCWIRVSHGFAGGQYGILFLPRVGQEVVVDFLEGNPDKPLITGRVFNADHMPPYPLPEEKTKSVIKTRSSVGGEGFNEIRFEDLKDKEQIFIHAEKDLDLRIKFDQRNFVGNDKHEIIKRDQKKIIERDEHRTVDQDAMVHVKRDQFVAIEGKSSTSVDKTLSLTVGGDVAEVFKAAHSMEVQSSCAIKACDVVIDASGSISLKVGGSFVSIDSSGVTISGPMVKINSGGSAGSPSLCSAVAPQIAEDPDEAATGDPGQDTKYTRETDESPWHDSTDEDPDKHWIGIRLWDDNGEPLPGERYEVVLPDGTTIARGTLDHKGEAYISGIDPGSCEIKFPALDALTWEPGPAAGGESGESGNAAAGTPPSAPSV